MRIAITHPYSWPEVRRGAERIIVETARALARRGHDVTIFTAGHEPGTSTSSDGVRTVRLRQFTDRRHGHQATFAWRLFPRLVTGSFDVVHSLMPRDMAVAIRAQRFGGYRTVYDEMGIPFVTWTRRSRDGGARMRIVRDVDVYACMSRHALDRLEAGSDRRGVLLPGGVRLDEFQPAARRTDRPTLLFSGAMGAAYKRPGVLLEAASLLLEDVPDLRVWLSGPGDSAALMAAAPPAVRGHVEVLPLGDPDGLADRYGRAWATVLPSVGESFGMVLLESLACGTPIVVTTDAAPKELVSPGTGVTCSPDGPEPLAMAIREGLELARDPATATRCRESVRGHDWDDGIAPLLETLYATPR